jgi:hypothetical protein
MPLDMQKELFLITVSEEKSDRISSFLQFHLLAKWKSSSMLAKYRQTKHLCYAEMTLAELHCTYMLPLPLA